MVAQATSDFPVGCIRDDEEPDFIIESGSDALGIEVTRIFHDPYPNEPALQVEESEREQITQLARTFAEREGIPPLTVSVHFGSYPRLKKSDRSPLAKAIAGIVKGIVPRPGLAVFWKNVFEDLDTVPEKLNAIHVLHLPDDSEHHWQCGGGGVIDSSFLDNLQSNIDGKDAKRPTYLRKCNRCWLIVAAIGDKPSSWFRFSEEMRSHTFTTEFELVFFVEGSSGQVNELRLARGTKDV